MLRLDSHQHFWRYSAGEYAWINDRMARPRRDFLPADLKPLLDEIGFHGSIAVQARQTVAETDSKLALLFASRLAGASTTLFSAAHPVVVAQNVGWYEEAFDALLAARVREVLAPVLDHQWSY